uniref:Uncharacterized protein n=1 Tax=Tanacetum cinerariifolium TaxID=118510 RepID=A0A699L9A2_TANCI|nr:hypothetical protein [Tanacetum cinerariifolium]
MGDEHLDTIPATKSDEFIKSSVENLIPIPSESEDECECDVPDWDDSQTKKISTFSNPLFDDSTSSDDESSHEEDIHEMILLLAWDRVFKIKDAFRNKQYKPKDIQELFRKLFNDVQNIHEELAEYINTPGWNRHAFYNNGDDDDEDCTIAVTPDFSITDSLIMKNEHLDTISEMESDKFIKSSIENLVSIPSESEDFSHIESECDMPDCDDSQTTNFSTFSNPLFDDYTYSDDESSY